MINQIKKNKINTSELISFLNKSENQKIIILEHTQEMKIE